MTRIPDDIVVAADYERHARQIMEPSLLAYASGGAGQGITALANRNAFARAGIYNRILRNVSDGHTSLDLFDRTYQHPVFLAPLAFQRLYHQDGEIATAQAAEATDSCMILSTLASTPLEEVSAHAWHKWFQLYFQPRRDDTLSLVRRAEKAGYEALVVTVDTPAIAMPAGAAQAGFEIPPHIRPVNIEGFEPPQAASLNPTDSPVFQGAMAHAPDWPDLEWLVAKTTLPVLVKGISHPQDARQCIECGAKGIIVSTHGGRSLDGLPAALQLLPAIRDTLDPMVPVLFDSGIRSGSDIFKAIAGGADAVLIGRLQAYALSVAGALGVAHMIKLLREELELTMALAGCASLADIDRTCLIPQE